VLSATAPSGFWLFGKRHLTLETCPPARDRASFHFFSEISRLRFASDRVSGRELVPEIISASVTGGHLNKSILHEKG